MSYEKEMMAAADQLYKPSYTENYEDKQAAFIKGVQWMYENSEEPELIQEIKDLKDKLWGLEYDKDDEIGALQEENKLLSDRIQELEKQLDDAADHIQ